MRAVREIRPPGVYPALEPPRARPLSVADTSIAGFVGLAEKGPLDEPVLVGSWDEFVAVYGTQRPSYLSRAVEGFFLNGGSACYVVRVAYRGRANQSEGSGAPGPAAAAWIARDGWDKPSYRVLALNEGRWGNSVWARFEHSVGARTLLTLDLDVGAGEARVNSVRGLERGALVRIFDREHSDHVVVTEVGDRTIRWGVATPIHHKYSSAGPTHLEVIEFSLHAALRDQRESFRGLQMSPLSRRYAPRVVAAESRLVRLEDEGSSSPVPHCLPAGSQAVRLAGGNDGIDTLTADDFIGIDQGPGHRTGLAALGSVDAVSLIAVPDAMVLYDRLPSAQADQELQRIHDAMITLCENLKDRFAVLDTPPAPDLEAVRKWRRRLASSYGALYYPWLTVQGKEGATLHVPPSGHVAGVYARCARNIGVHKAPANEVIQGAVGLRTNLNEEHLGLLNEEGIDTLRALPGRGIRIWGARTVSDDLDWRFVNVRRLFIMLRRSLEEGTEWAVFEPNDRSTWERLTREVTLFLKDLWGKGYFAGGAPEESFFVRCNGETNSFERRAAGQLTMEIGIAPAIPAEYILFTVVQQAGDGEGSEAATS